MLTIKLTQPQELCLNGIQAILITSRHGAAALVRATERRDVPVLAVGDATASAAQGFGFTDVQSAGGDGVALASLAAHRLNAANGAVLHVSGDKQAFDVVGALCQQGFDARLRLLYSGTPARHLPSEALKALAAGGIDYAAFFSPQTGRTFGKLVRQAGVAETMMHVTAVSISQNVMDSLDGLTWRKRLTAEKPTAAAVLDTLVASMPDAAPEDGAGQAR
jgi:uroporphyrinogen-III synthase